MNNYGPLGKASSTQVATLSDSQKNHILKAMANALLQHSNAILTANELDLAVSSELGLSKALVERLTLTPEKIKAMSEGILDVCSLSDPIGEIIEQYHNSDGLEISKVRVPLGLLMMIYESRPNVTADAAALAVKSGNAIILKGGKEAIHTNSCIANTLIDAGYKSGLPQHAIQFIDSSDRRITNALLVDTEHVDAIIPRGGPALKKAISAIAKVPILMTGAGVCHLYVSSTATPDMAVSIALNAKTQRPGVCNAIETLLIHKDYPEPFNLLKSLMSAGVHLKVCPKTLNQLESELNLSEISEVIKSKFDTLFSLADENDFSEEYLALTLAVKQVSSTQEALAHIQKYSTGHSEAIVTQDIEEAELFLNRVDSACVYHNASTRFTDGGCFGFGCEIGIATQKLHARGPMGLKEITSYKYQIRGNGQTRQ